LFVGGRAGFAHTGGGHSLASSDFLDLYAFDVSATTWFVPALAGSAASVALMPAAIAEIGVAVTDITLRSQHELAVAPRIFVGASLSVASRVIGVVVRAGYLWIPWFGAGGPGVDFHYTGPEVTVGLEHLR